MIRVTVKPAEVTVRWHLRDAVLLGAAMALLALGLMAAGASLELLAVQGVCR